MPFVCYKLQIIQIDTLSKPHQMSLYEPADGLLGTHVTWHDVELQMQRVLGTTAKFGENRQICDIGDMKVTY